MKDRLREAAFNLLGPAIRGKHAVDLFAGTGALGLEALSRGAGFATLIERHFPTADVIRENARLLGVESQSTVFRGDAFVWGREICAADSTAPAGIEAMPWVVFCSPPYAFFRDRLDDLCQLLARCQQAIVIRVESQKLRQLRPVPFVEPDLTIGPIVTKTPIRRRRYASLDAAAFEFA